VAGDRNNLKIINTGIGGRILVRPPNFWWVVRGAIKAGDDKPGGCRSSLPMTPEASHADIPHGLLPERDQPAN